MSSKFDFESMTVTELRAKLKKHGLSTAGKKADLIARLSSSTETVKEGKQEEDSDHDDNDAHSMEVESSKPKRQVKKRKNDEVEETLDGENKKQVVEAASTSGRRASSRLKQHNEQEEEEEKTVGKWQEDGTLLYLDSSEIKGSTKIIGFDMDDTLIHTKSGRTHAISRNDWEWNFEQVPKKLQELHQQGYKIVIFTNQGGINGKNGYDPTKAAQIKGKVSDLSAALGFPLQAFVATTDDKFRKPATYMWDFMVEHCNHGIAPDLANCAYVGDAAGRPAAGARKKKDFSCSDRKFAFNVGISFSTPEEYFLGQAAEPFDWGCNFNPKDYAFGSEITEGGVAKLTSSSQEMVLLVGYPASGKSTFSKTYLVPNGYVHVNRDTLKTQDKCLKVAEQALKDKKSVVIDNTNPSPDVRASYIALAKAAKVPVRCFWMQADEDFAKHLNYFRERITDGESAHVPRIGYAVFNKSFVAPTVSEGFTEVRRVHFVPKFQSPQHEALFKQYA